MTKGMSIESEHELGGGSSPPSSLGLCTGASDSRTVSYSVMQSSMKLI